MSHVHDGPLASYNSLLDPSLQTYFGKPHIRRHLRKAGLVKKNGQIIPEETMRSHFAKQVHIEHVKDLLTQEIIYKVLDIERTRQVAIKNELEMVAKKELVKQVRNDLRHKGDEAILQFVVPRPLTASVRRSSLVHTVRPVSGQPHSTQTPIPSRSSLFSTVGSKQKKLVGGRRPGDHKKTVSVVDFRHSGIDDKHLHMLGQQALWKITMGELTTGLRPTSPYLLPIPSPLGPLLASDHGSSSGRRRNHRITPPTGSRGTIRRQQHSKVPNPPSSGQSGQSGSTRKPKKPQSDHNGDTDE